MIMNNILKKIKESNVIGISYHTSPDGDALGSSLALMMALRKMGKNPYILSKEEVPSSYSFLPYAKEVSKLQKQVLPSTECVIILDCGNAERICAELSLEKKEYDLINIDHHLSNELYGDLNYVDTNASATGEVVYQMLKLLGVCIDKEIATCLYTSIITDCGSFRHSNTTSVTHAIAGDLINTGIDFSEIHRKIFETKELKQIKLMGKVIEKMYLTSNNKISIMEITEEMLSDLNMEADNVDVISIGLQPSSVEVALLLKEKGEGVKVSLRSKNEVDVRKIAEQFGGGGHTKAAGLYLHKNLIEARKTIIQEIEKELI